MDPVIRRGYRLEELLRLSGVGEGREEGGGARVLNKRNLRKLGEIMRNTNLTQNFSF